MSHRVAILGSTGSIGCNAIEVIEHLGPPHRAVALSGNQQIDKLAEQARRVNARAVGIADASKRGALADALAGSGAKVYAGDEGLVELVQRDDVDVVLAAIVGAAGLRPSLAAVRAGKRLALANKESLVVAGSLLIREARERNVEILPVDSEHSAVFQAMACGKLSEVRRVILTASGGPLRTCSAEQIENATVAEAMRHPTWSMGGKITIDSASMFNKALEIIEACWLFDLPPEKVEVVVHPESIVHSMVEFVDGSVIAQLSPPDMRTPIQHALTHPARSDGCSKRFDITRAFSLNFEPPDPRRFPALRLAYVVAAERGTSGAVLNAANEIAVAAFMNEKIRFGAISRVVEQTIDAHKVDREPSLEQLLDADAWARRHANDLIAKLS